MDKNPEKNALPISAVLSPFFYLGQYEKTIFYDVPIKKMEAYNV